MAVVIPNAGRRRKGSQGSRRKGSGFDPETELAQQLRFTGIEGWEREHQFHPVRKWRIDFAWPTEKIGLEVEGKVFGRKCDKPGCGKVLAGGRHTRGQGFEADCEKYNAATLAGWRVVRVTGDMIRSGQALALVEELVGKGKNPGTQRELGIGDRPNW